MAETSPLDLLRTEEILGKKPQNFYGMSPEESQKYIDAQKGFVKSLEERYAQPNLWSVAAGFAKPQLGGFLASLGSASEELGKQAEKQRDIQLPLYKARAELSAYEAAMGQKAKAAGKAEKIVGEKRTPTPTEQMEITSLTEGPTKGAEAGAAAQRSQAEQMMSAIRTAGDWATLVKDLGGKFTEEQIGEFLRNNPSMVPPAGTPDQYKPKPKEPAAGGAGTATKVEEPAASAEQKATARRTPIPGVDVENLTEGQYLAAKKNYETQKQEVYKELSGNVQTQANAGKEVYQTAQQIHDLASDPALTKIFAMFEKGNPAGTIGQMLESQSLSSTLANIRQYAEKNRLGGGEALTKLNNLEALMGDLQNNMQNAVINPTNERTRAEIASMPNVRNTQDAFLRRIRYIANEGLMKYETQHALDRASKGKSFDPFHWTINPEYSSVTKNATTRRDNIMRTPATQDRPAFMRGSIDESAYKGEKKSGRLTAKELREQAKD